MTHLHFSRMFLCCLEGKNKMIIFWGPTKPGLCSKLEPFKTSWQLLRVRHNSWLIFMKFWPTQLLENSLKEEKVFCHLLDWSQAFTYALSPRNNREASISSRVAPKPRLGKLSFWLEILVKKLSSALSIFQKAHFIKFWKNKFFPCFTKVT